MHGSKRSSVRPRVVLALLLILALLATGCGAGQPSPLETATDAYIYGYPLVLMYYTRQTSVATGQAAINHFVNAPTLLGPAYRNVVRPNNDTLYSQSFLDLTSGPMVLHVPDTTGSFYVMQIMDAWSNTFADPGTRTTGSSAQDFAIVGPDWNTPLPPTLKVLASPTNMVWILGRTQVVANLPPQGSCAAIDYATVHNIQQGYSLTPLGGPPNPGLAPAPASLTPPQQVAALSGVEFFQILSTLMRDYPAPKQDEAALSRFASIGFVPGADFRPPASIIDDINAAPAAALAKMNAAWQAVGQKENGWDVMRSGIGTYGTDYLTRGAVAVGLFAANLPQDAIYAQTYSDQNGNPLSGASDYVIMLSPVPPVGGFWSVTLYDADGYFIQNGICRYAIHSTDQAISGQSTVRLLLQQNPPTDPSQMGYWLPTPPGSFNLMLRMYWPLADALGGTWQPPPVQMQ